MMKLLLVIAYICNTANIMAQSQTGRLSIKPMVGVNFSGFSNAAIDIYQTKVGLTGGAELEYGVNPWLGLSLGLMYSQKERKLMVLMVGWLLMKKVTGGSQK